MSLVFLALAAAHFVLLAVLVLRWSSFDLQVQRVASIVMAVALALAYDNLIIGLGGTIGTSELLADLSRCRFLLRLIVTPTVILGSVLIGQRARVSFTVRLTLPAQVLTIAMIGLGVLLDGLWPALEPVTAQGVLRYAPADPVLPVPAIVAVSAALVVGGALWRLGVTSWMLLGSAVMFVASGVPAGDLPLVGNLAGLTFVAGLVATVVVLAAGRTAPTSS